MTIGKRKGFTSKGAGAAPGNDSNKKVGGSLSKSDHFYLQEAYGLIRDTGIGDTYMDASGGTVSDWADPRNHPEWKYEFVCGADYYNKGFDKTHPLI